MEYIIPPSAREAGTHEFIIESSCNGMFGIPWNGDTIQPPDMNRWFRLDSADLVVPNMDAWGLFWDFETLKQLADALEGNVPLVIFVLSREKALSFNEIAYRIRRLPWRMKL